MVAVITNESLKKELLAQGMREDPAVTWLEKPGSLKGADYLIDLLFEPGTERIEELVNSGANTVIVNDVTGTLDRLPPRFVRINGWPGFLTREIVEASAIDARDKAAAEEAFAGFGKKIEWIADRPGFVSARVISMIINEAYMAIEENVSSREEIDIAMKLGTNYPRGPFEWAKLLGLKNINNLLEKLAEKQVQYKPCALLVKEASGK